MTNFFVLLSPLQWWFRQLKEMFPEALIDWLAGLPKRSEMHLHGSEATVLTGGKRVSIPIGNEFSTLDAAVASRRSDLPRRLSLDVILPPSEALIRKHELPIGSRHRIRQILSLDLSRDTPLDPQDVVWKERIKGRKGEKILVDQFIIKRSLIDGLTSVLSANHILLGRVMVHGKSDEDPVVVFEDKAMRSKATGLWPKLNYALLVVLVICLTVPLLLPYLRDVDRLELLAEERTILTGKLVELRSEVNEKKEALNTADTIASAMQDRRHRIDILRELTVRLPDEAWLNDLEISDDLLRFSGFTKGSAAELVISLASSPHFINPRLTGPVSIAPGTGAERYEISIDLKRGLQ